MNNVPKYPHVMKRFYEAMHRHNFSFIFCQSVLLVMHKHTTLVSGVNF